MYTASPDIYTYCPTLSLHDALPIFDDRRARPAGVVFLRFRIEVGLLEVAQRRPDQDPALVVRLQRAAGRGVEVGQLRQRHVHAERSEEHTSELQSLMRISYAVLCLKKPILST